jgi:uncharacterized delta-60 repeat protein
MFKSRSKRAKHRSVSRRGWNIFFCRPIIELLEDRRLLSWALDPAFGSSGQKDWPTNDAAQTHAITFQSVSGEQRILMAGYDIYNHPGDVVVQHFALARLHPDGSPDTSFGPNGNGIVTPDFYGTSAGNTINAIKIEQASSPICGDAVNVNSDKIVVAGTAAPSPIVPSDRVIALMRFCGTGTMAGQVDTSFGGNPAPWIAGGGNDPPGGVTVNITDGCGGWMRGAEGLALAIQPDGKIVVGGHGNLSFACVAATSNYFVVARLDTDAACRAAQPVPLNPGCSDLSFNATDGHSTLNRGRYYFQVASGRDDEVHAVQLVQNGSNFDILVAGRDKATVSPPAYAYAQFAVALVKNDGTGLVPTFASDSQNIRLIDFGTLQAPQDDIAWGLVRQDLFPNAIFVGGTTCPLGCTGLTPQSDFALARLTSTGNLDTGFHSNGKLTFDVGIANIGYSLAFHTLPGDQNPRIVIGGYSYPSVTSAPYMAGGRVVYDGSLPPDTFQSSFAGTPIGSDGDQVRQLAVQDDNKIVAGGFHSRTSPALPDFAAIRLCPTPDGSNCSGGNIASGGDRQGTQPPAAPEPGLVGSVTLEAVAVLTNLPAPVILMHDSPAPPMPGDGAGVRQSTAAEATPLFIPVEMQVSFVMATADLEPTFQDPLAPVAV